MLGVSRGKLWGLKQNDRVQKFSDRVPKDKCHTLKNNDRPLKPKFQVQKDNNDVPRYKFHALRSNDRVPERKV
jgi:hypothetical protein